MKCAFLRRIALFMRPNQAQIKPKNNEAEALALEAILRYPILKSSSEEEDTKEGSKPPAPEIDFREWEDGEEPPQIDTR